jgi:hypothetical protein
MTTRAAFGGPVSQASRCAIEFAEDSVIDGLDVAQPFSIFGTGISATLGLLSRQPAMSGLPM